MTLVEGNKERDYIQTLYLCPATSVSRIGDSKVNKKRKNPEDLVETCSAKNNLGIENLKIEDEIMEDIKDNKLIFISKDADMEDIDEVELIFKYIHKKVCYQEERIRTNCEKD